MPLVNAHEGIEHATSEEAMSHEETFGDIFWNNEWNVVAIGSLVIGVLTFLSVIFKQSSSHRQKKVLFILLVFTIVFSTVYIAADTIRTNIMSETGGPVHWHTDYEVWKCDNRLDLVDPTGLSNKIGTPLFHEHNDDRIHIEGAVRSLSSLGIDDYFSVVGGVLTPTSFAYPDENRGIVVAENGDLCGDEPGEVQIWLYRIENPRDIGEWRYTLTRLNDPGDYVSAPYGNVPPGDCVIIEFDEDTTGTNHMCIFYEAAVDRGELSAN